MQVLTIGQVARQAGVGVETVRFYERQGLLDPPPRRASGYRQYAPDMVTRIQFIRRAKELGFALREIRELLSLRLAPETTCGDIKQQAEAKMVDIDAKLRDLQRMRMALAQLVDACSGSGPTSQCPILDALESHAAAVSTSPHPKYTAATGESEAARATICKRGETMMTVIQLHVIGAEKMYCAGCETRVSTALRRLPGVRDVRASAETQQIAVTIDPSAVSREQVCARLQQLGYEVTL